MAKTYNNLYPDIYSFESLHAAYMLARRGKRDRREVQKFEQDLEGNLIQLQNELIWGMYQTGHYRQFIVNEPKERLVAALPLRASGCCDRVCSSGGVQPSLIRCSRIAPSVCAAVNRAASRSISPSAHS